LAGSIQDNGGGRRHRHRHHHHRPTHSPHQPRQPTKHQSIAAHLLPSVSLREEAEQQSLSFALMHAPHPDSNASLDTEMRKRKSEWVMRERKKGYTTATKKDPSSHRLSLFGRNEKIVELQIWIFAFSIGPHV
jgi:hypothetical protein